jgi:aminoglycoside 2'-N-acetyltransferase I
MASNPACRRRGHHWSMRVRSLGTHALTSAELDAIRALLEDAFGPDEDDRFTEEDWRHSVGGVHVLLDNAGTIVSHASVVERRIHVAGFPLRTGYVEAVGTAPASQGRGYGTQVMEVIGAHIRNTYQMGALGTGRHAFYQRLGWERWQGPSFVRTAAGERGTPDDDGYLMVLRTPASPALDLTATISCDWRPGDVW